MKQAHEPLEKVRQSYKVDWYRCPIAKDQLKQLTQRSDLKGMLQALGYLALVVVTGAVSWYLFTHRIWGAFAVALFCFGTITSFTPGLVTHELSHGTVFKTKSLNSFFLRLHSLLGWVSFHHYRRSHTFPLCIPCGCSGSSPSTCRGSGQCCDRRSHWRSPASQTVGMGAAALSCRRDRGGHRVQAVAPAGPGHLWRFHRLLVDVFRRRAHA